MRIPKLTTLACLAALVGGAPALRSQQDDFGPYKFDVKIKLGLYGGDLQRTKYDNKIIGMGFSARRDVFGPGRAIAAELTWEHIPSRWNNVIDFETHNQYNTNQDWLDRGVLSMHPYWSWDFRKEAASGLSLLLSYQSKMPSGLGWQPLDKLLDGMDWYAGLRLDNYKVLSEFRWRLGDQTGMREIPPASGGVPTPPWYAGGFGAFHEEATGLTPGAFAGVRFTINDGFAFDLGTRYFGTKHWEMTPGSYFKTETDGHDTKYRISESTSYGYSIEFAIVIKL